MVGKKQWNIPLPLFTAGIHSAVNWIIAAIGLHLFLPETLQASREKIQRLSHAAYWIKVVPCGVAAALDIGLSNASMRFISLSFYTMIKSTVSGWVLLFAFVFGLDKPTWSHILIVGLICSGAVLTYAGEAEIDAIGFVMISSATMISGLRWVLTQLLLQKRSLGLNHPLLTIYFMSPVMCVSLLFLSYVMEFGKGFDQTTGHPNSTLVVTAHAEPIRDISKIPPEVASYMTLGGVLAFCMTLSEFLLISATSVLTLCIAGICKEILMIFVAMAVYEDQMAPMKWVGLVVTCIGVLWYNLIRLKPHHSTEDEEVAYVDTNEIKAS